MTQSNSAQDTWSNEAVVESNFRIGVTPDEPPHPSSSQPPTDKAPEGRTKRS